MLNEKEIQNVYAYNAKSEEIHISQAVSGRKGYWCLGCQREMQAVISTKTNRISYFRHDALASKGFLKCTFSDESFRHTLAKRILLGTKRVKVPAVYKYPPENLSGGANLLAPARFIEAKYVDQELYFYETENGEICSSKSAFTDENKYLLLKPDVIFFDENKMPVLLIEIVVTHKVSEKKRLDLKRLGIDAIQITIPKDSPENIERTLETSERTKWIYNYEQERTNYIPIPNTSSEGISSIDDDQRKLFAESFKCRASQIGNLIRTIGRCLDAEQYRSIAGKVESEIHRVERNTEEHRVAFEKKQREYYERIERLRSEARKRVHTKYGDRRDQFEKRNRDLEERYLRKRGDLERNTNATIRAIAELEKQIAPLGRDIVEERKYIENIEREIVNIGENITNHRDSEKSATYDIERESENRRSVENKYSELGIEIERRFEAEERELERQFQELRDTFTIAVKTRTNSGIGFTAGYKRTLIELERISDLKAHKSLNSRYGKAWECFKNKTYKNWHD